jgi:hypothetical protein
MEMKKERPIFTRTDMAERELQHLTSFRELLTAGNDLILAIAMADLGYMAACNGLTPHLKTAIENWKEATRGKV